MTDRLAHDKTHNGPRKKYAVASYTGTICLSIQKSKVVRVQFNNIHFQYRSINFRRVWAGGAGAGGRRAARCAFTFIVYLAE